jgi:hypothetical protein
MPVTVSVAVSLFTKHTNVCFILFHVPPKDCVGLAAEPYGLGKVFIMQGVNHAFGVGLAKML